MRELFIEEVRPEAEHNGVDYEWIASYYDTSYNICVRKIKLNKQLEIDKLYSFNLVDENDDDTYHYIVLKIESDNVYYISEYYDGLIIIKETLLGNGWIKCNINELGINLNDYKIR